MLTAHIVVIISNIQILNHYVVHLKLIKYYLSIVSQLKKKGATQKSAYFTGRTEASQKTGCIGWVLKNK